MLCSCSNDAAKNAEWEKKQKGAIENFIARTNGTVKVGSIAVSALDKSFTLSNVTGSVPISYAVPGAGPARCVLDFTVAQVRGEGLNTADAPGSVDTLRKLTVTDYVAVSKFEGFSNDPQSGQGKPASEEMFTSKYAASEWAYYDVKGDFSVLAELFSGRFDKEIVAKLAGFSIGEGTAKNYLIENFFPDTGAEAEGKARSARFMMSSASYKSASVDGVGPGEMKNIELFFGENQVASLETVSFKRFAVPGLLTKFFPMDDLSRKSEEELAQLALDQEIVLDDIRVANLRVTPEPDITVTLRDAGLTIKRVKPAGALKLDIQNLVIPLEALHVGEEEGQSDFKSIYDKPLSISLVFDLDGEEKTPQTGEYVIRLNKIYFAENNLGSVNISAELDRKKDERAGEGKYHFDPDEFSLARAALGIKDSGMVDLGFKAASLMGGSGLSKEDGAALMRKLAGFVLTTQCARISQALQGVCADLDKFIQVPGEFELTYAPAHPLGIDELMEKLLSADDPKVIGLSWKYTPPRQ
jgi:hypothetical protein